MAGRHKCIHDMYSKLHPVEVSESQTEFINCCRSPSAQWLTALQNDWLDGNQNTNLTASNTEKVDWERRLGAFLVAWGGKEWSGRGVQTASAGIVCCLIIALDIQLYIFRNIRKNARNTLASSLEVATILMQWWEIWPPRIFELFFSFFHSALRPILYFLFF